MKNITKQIKDAISADALWSVSDFFYLIEMLSNKGYETSYWKDEEYWATLLHGGKRIGYIWQKYPLIFIKEDCADDLKTFTNELKYIVVVKSKDLEGEEFTIDMDEDLTNRIRYGVNTKSFSANDFWFYTVT